MPTSSRISATLTSDNLPALMAPIPCDTCRGGGTINNSFDGDPLYDQPCPDCGETGLQPYPGTFKQQRLDAADIINGAFAMLEPLAQNIALFMSHNSAGDTTRYSLKIGDDYYEPKVGVWGTAGSNYDAVTHSALDKFHAVATQSHGLLAELDAETAAFRTKRAHELGVLL